MGVGYGISGKIKNMDNINAIFWFVDFRVILMTITIAVLLLLIGCIIGLFWYFDFKYISTNKHYFKNNFKRLLWIQNVYLRIKQFKIKQ